MQFVFIYLLVLFLLKKVTEKAEYKQKIGNGVYYYMANNLQNYFEFVMCNKQEASSLKVRISTIITLVAPASKLLNINSSTTLVKSNKYKLERKELQTFLGKRLIFFIPRR